MIYKVDFEPWTSIPYGRPLANQLLRVVNNKGKDSPANWTALAQQVSQSSYVVLLAWFLMKLLKSRYYLPVVILRD